MGSQDTILVIIGIFSGLVAYQAYTVSGFLPALGVLLNASWILFNLRTKINIWKALGTLLDPFHTAITFFLLGFTWAALEGLGLSGSVFGGFAASFVGAVFSMFVFKYWTIGD